MGINFSFFDQEIQEELNILAQQHNQKSRLSNLNKNLQPPTNHSVHKNVNKNPNTIYIPQLGGNIIVNKQKKIYIKQIEIQDFQEKFIINLFEQRKSLSHKNFVTVKNYYFQNDINNNNCKAQYQNCQQYSFCCCQSQSKLLKIQFEPLFFNVHSLIKFYCQQRRPLQQSEIRRIMKSVVECLIFLKKNNTYHGDIKPTTIFLNPKTKQVKLADSLLFNNGKTAFQIVLQDPYSESFLTPNQLQKSKKGMFDNQSLIYQSEVFRVGMTLIQMMTFQSSMQAYDLQKLQIKPEFIEKKLHQMQEYGYSYSLVDLSLRCIHKIGMKRPQLQQIFQLL